MRLKVIKYLTVISFFFAFNFTNVNANEKIVYIDTNYILNQSLVGKSILAKLNSKQKKNIESFKKTEKSFKETEKKIIASKNVTSEEEFKKKVLELRNTVKAYQVSRKKAQEDLIKEKNKLNNKLLDLLTPILTAYSKENSISMIIEKRNIIIGKTSLDITDEIVNILNKKIKKL
jgi:Skp family chaperone for outer membrane proteins